MHPLFHNIYEFYLIFYDFISLSILILFGAGFANTFLHVVPGVEIKAMYEIIVSHTPEQGICTLNHTIPASPPQCLTVTEGINIKFNLLGFIIPTERFKSIILTFLYNPTRLWALQTSPH